MSAFIELTNSFKTKVILSPYGASIYDIQTLDKNDNLESIVVSPKDENDFKNATSYFGKSLGRTAGRIENGTFELDNVKYTIKSNDPNGLHGGLDSISYKEFDYIKEEDDEIYSVIFTYQSPDLESGYPGNVDYKITYYLYKNKNQLEVSYEAISDKKTLMNMANHSYFNLSGNIKRDILNHELYLNSTRLGKLINMIPKEIMNASEIYSFKTPHKIGDYIKSEEIINSANGYDFPYLFDEVGLAYKNAELKDNESGRSLSIYTTYPCCVIYTCNYPEDLVVNNNQKLKQYEAICLECSYFPNSVNSSFMTNKKDILDKDTNYFERVIYKFN